MIKSRCVNLTVVVACIAIFATTSFGRSVLTNNTNVKGLDYVGSADGKSFFADMTIERNWTEARQFCNESGMRLPALTSVNQARIVSNLSQPETTFWTAGRDGQDIVEFVWDHNNGPVFGVLPFAWYAGYQTCLVLYTNSTPPHIHQSFDAWPCDIRLSTLCELVDP